MIKVSNLTKKYGNRIAVDNISFNVNKGEIVGFLGPNGAGKSTTMNILTGYISATSGVVKINNIDILCEPINAKKNIGYLPETPPLYMDMKVGEYLNFVYDLKKIKNQNKNEHISEICALVQITDVRDRLIKNLSKGYKQRVGLAQALIGNPELLILDEPTVGLDPKQIIEIRNLVRELGKKHTVILSSHILSEIQAVCDKVMIISQGKIVANEKTQNLSNAISEEKKILLDVIGEHDKIFEAISGLESIEKIEGNFRKNFEDNFDSETTPKTQRINSFIIYPKEEQDIRESLSKAVTASGGTIVGLRSLELSLEEVFLKLTDETNINSLSNSNNSNVESAENLEVQKDLESRANEHEEIKEQEYQEQEYQEYQEGDNE